MLQPKDRQVEQTNTHTHTITTTTKNKTCMYVVYKRLISDLEIHTD